MKTNKLTGKAEIERLKKIIEAYEEHTARTVMCGEIRFPDPDDDSKMSFVITAPHFKDEERFIQLVALQVSAILRTIGISEIKTENDTAGSVRPPDESGDTVRG